MGINKLFFASSMLSALALAAPALNPRDIVTDIVWTTVDVTTTIYLNDAAALPTDTSVTVTNTATMTFTMAEVTPTPAAIVPTTTMITTTAAPAAAPAAVAVAPVGDAVVDTTAAAVPTTMAASANGGPTSASETADCEGEGDACVGDVTYWDGGLGACGTVVDTNNDLAIALPFEFMGTLSNTNPYCNRQVTLFNPTSGTTIQATVMDKCMGCDDRSIDCTLELFNAITDNLGNGRMHGIEWWFS